MEEVVKNKAVSESEQAEGKIHPPQPEFSEPLILRIFQATPQNNLDKILIPFSVYPHLI